MILKAFCKITKTLVNANSHMASINEAKMALALTLGLERYAVDKLWMGEIYSLVYPVLPR